MYGGWIAVRNKIIGGLYRQALKRIFFLRDPEKAHDSMTAMGEWLGRFWLTRLKTHFLFFYSHPALEQNILGLKFANPIGLAAGFDKDARLTQILPEVGFGFEEIGSITGEPCAGNSGQRLWRLPRSRSLVVYYGLKNDGAEKIAVKLTKLKFKFPLGVSVAKTNCAATAETDAGVADYVKALNHFVVAGVGDYYTVNISCPNAFGGQPFTDAGRLEKLMTVIDAAPTIKPIFLKLSPDLSCAEVDEIITVARRHRVDGFICSNLTKKLDNQNILDKNIPDRGGLSGKIVEPLAEKLIKYIYRVTGGKYIIIACGGVFTAADAYRKIRLGASLIQLITGMIYEGPQVIGEINRGLVKLLARDGFQNISRAVGVDNK